MNKLVVVRKYANVKTLEAKHKTVCFTAYSHLPNREPVDRTQSPFVLFKKCGICCYGNAYLRTFAPIATAHRYCARKFIRHVMHRARALRNKLNNDREDGHYYSFAWI